MANNIKAGLFLLISIAFSLSLNSCIKKTNTKVAESQSQKVISSGTIVYFDLDKVIANYDMANELKSVVESKIQGIQDEINRRANDLQSKVNQFRDNLNKGLITRGEAQIKAQELEDKKNEFNIYANQKQQEIAEQQQVMLNKIGNSIKEFLDKYNKKKKYAMIISTSGTVLPAPVVAADPNLDITQDIITNINNEYIEAKAKGKVSLSLSTTNKKK